MPRGVAIRALIDTGCDLTAVSGQVFQRLPLTPEKTVPMQTAGGSAPVSLYRVSLGIYDPRSANAPSLIRPSLLVSQLAVALPVDALIGMDVLGECLFVLDGPGKQFILGF